jgi:hypothetical protein
VATPAAEVNPRCVFVVNGTGCEAASVTCSVSLELTAVAVEMLWTGGWKVGGRPGGVYWVPAST